MFNTVHIHTATAPKQDDSDYGHTAHAYAVIARLGRAHITLVGHMPNATSTSAALRAAALGMRAARTLFTSPLLRRITPVTVHLPSATAALAANGTTRSQPTDPKERRLIRVLSKASVAPNITFTDKPEQENSAIDVICQQIASDHALQAPAV